MTYHLFDVTYTDALFTPVDCEKIIRQYKRGPFEGGAVREQYSDFTQRRAQVSFIAPGVRSAWIFKTLQRAVRSVNEQVYRFDLDGFREGFQFTKYEVGGHHAWHADIGANERQYRKLSLTVQLSAESAYDGGELQFFTAAQIEAPKRQGVIATFPSFLVHRIQPVTRGVRYALVTWVAGKEPFK